MASMPQLGDPKLLQKLEQARNITSLDASTSVAGVPSPGASNAFLEKSDKEVADALRRIAQVAARQIIVARRQQIYRIGRSELYFLSKQKIFWNGSEGQWNGVGPNGSILAADNYECESFDYTTNFYKGYGESFMTTASQNVPGVPFHAEDPTRREDIDAAKSASSAAELIARQNDASQLLAKLAYHGFTGGLMATYSRSVSDGLRFGFEADPQTGELTNIPKIRQLISVMGGLDISVPMYADSQAEMDYLCWFLDCPRSRAHATYPWMEGKIPAASDMRDDDVLARLFRAAIRGNISPVMPSDAMEDICTIMRMWMRPSMFWYEKDLDIRSRLMKMFPKGVLVHYISNQYAASFSENMDDHWVVDCATEGRGLARPGIGETFIDVQDQINVLSNLFHEYLVYGIPPIFHHAKALNKEAIQQMTAKVAQFLPVNMADQLESVSDLFWSPTPAQVPEALISRLDALAGPIGQFLTGIFPALVGAGVSGVANDTASGYKMQLQQSMGRVAFFYRKLKSVYQRTIYNSVREFADNQDRDIALASKDPYKKPQMINPISIRKGNFNVFPEADDAYPNLFSDQKEVFMQMFEIAEKNPAMQADIEEPANQNQIKSAFGMPDWVSAGEDSYLKQMKEIDELMAVSPESFAGMEDAEIESMLPTVQILPRDRDSIEAETITRWASSDSGMEALVNNPLGYWNVMAHGKMHDDRIAAKAPPPDIKRSMTIPLDKMPQAAQAQELEKAGDQVTPQDFLIKHEADRDLKTAAPPKDNADGKSKEGDK